MHYLLLLFFTVYPVANLVSLGEGAGLATVTGGLLLIGAPFFLAKQALVNGEKFHVSTPMLMMIMLVLFCIASGLWAYSDALYQSGIFELAQTLALLLVVDLFVKESKQVDQLMQAFIVGTLILAGFLFFEYAAGEVYEGATETYGEERYSVGGADPNIKAMQLSIGLALLLGHTPLSRLLAVNYAAAFALFTAVVLTGSRTGFVACAAILSVYVLYQANLRQALWRWGILVAMVLAIYAFWDFQESEISVDRMENMVEQGLDTDLAGREEIWVKAADVFSQHMVLGVGYSSFAAYNKDVFGGSGLVTHNTHLNFLVELGLIGYVLFLAAYAFAPAYWRRLNDIAVKRTYAGVFAALLLCSITLNLEQHFVFWVFIILLDKSLRGQRAEEVSVGAHRNPELEARLQALKRPEITEPAI